MDPSRKLKSYDGGTPSELLAVLLRVSVLADMHDDGKEIAQVSREALAATLKTMTAVGFIDGALKMLQTANAQVSPRVETTIYFHLTFHRYSTACWLYSGTESAT